MTKRKLTKISLGGRPPSRLNPGVRQWSLHNKDDQYRGVLQLGVVGINDVRVDIHTLGFWDHRVVPVDSTRKAIDEMLKVRGYYIDWKEDGNAIPS